MAKRTLRVTMEIVVEDLTKDELEALGEEDEERDEGLSEVGEMIPFDLEEIIASPFNREADQTELFAGTGIFAKFTGAEIVSAEFVPAPLSGATHD